MDRNILLKELLKSIKKYKVHGLNINLVDRDKETEIIINWICREVPWNYVVYGPWGCGKTEFARSLVSSLREIKDIVATYVDLAQTELDRALISKPEVKDRIIEVVKEVIGGLSKLPLKVWTLLSEIHKMYKLIGKYLVIVIDEVTTSLEKHEVSIRDYVATLDKAIHEWKEEFDLKNIVIVLFTSELTMLQHFKREVGKSLAIYEMWNLPKRDFKELLERVDCPIKYDMLWKLSGGNPRVIYELKVFYNWNVSLWLEKLITQCWFLYVTVRRDEKLLHYFEGLLENVNNVIPVPLTVELRRQIRESQLTYELLKQNMIVPLEPRHLRMTLVEEYEWVGEEWAWQIPAYYHVFKTIVSAKEKPKPDDVIKHLN